MLAVGHVSGTDYVIITPDRDIYVESLDAGNPDIVRSWPGGARRGLPRGIPAANVYSFRGISAREYRQLLERGRNEVATELERRAGAGAVADAADGGAGAAPAAVAAEP